MLHGCRIGDNTLIGMQVIIMDGAKVGSNCLIAADAVILEGKEIPDNSLVVGSPAESSVKWTTSGLPDEGTRRNLRSELQAVQVDPASG